jgi:hypothetical protein
MESDSPFVVVPAAPETVVQTRAQILRAGEPPIADAMIEIGAAEPDRRGYLRWKGRIFVPLGHFLPQGSRCTLLIGGTVLLEIVITRVELVSERITAQFETVEQAGLRG